MQRTILFVIEYYMHTDAHITDVQVPRPRCIMHSTKQLISAYFFRKTKCTICFAYVKKKTYTPQGTSSLEQESTDKQLEKQTIAGKTNLEWITGDDLLILVRSELRIFILLTKNTDYAAKSPRN